MRHTTETEQPMERSWYCVHSPFATDSPTAPEQPTRSMRHAAGTKHFQRGDGRRTSCYIACMERSREADVAGVRSALMQKQDSLLTAKVTRCHDRAKQEKVPLLAHLPRVDAACAAGVSQHGSANQDVAG